MATAYSAPKHVVIFSRKCLFLNSSQKQKEMNTEVDEISKDDEFELYFTSHQPPSREMLAAIPDSLTFKLQGDELRTFIKERCSDGDMVLICGAVDEDLHVAASTKSFLISASWVFPEPKVVQYGIPAPTPRKMRAILDIIVNQKSWYYSCRFNDPVPTKVVSLCFANTYSGVSADEKAMAEAFQAILKDGKNSPVIKSALICHLMAAILHDKDFIEVQDWAIAPSSSTVPNQTMEELKEHVRYMMNGRKPAAMFVRHTATRKSRFDRREQREDPSYCQKHFQSIRMNDPYKGKLKGRVVCVFDDYLTNGSTFEALRNLLVFCQVKKIIFVSIGKFVRGSESLYMQKSFTINGDVYNEYTATFVNTSEHEAHFDYSARRSLEELKVLASHLGNDQ